MCTSDVMYALCTVRYLPIHLYYQIIHTSIDRLIYTYK